MREKKYGKRYGSEGGIKRTEILNYDRSCHDIIVLCERTVSTYISRVPSLHSFQGFRVAMLGRHMK